MLTEIFPTYLYYKIIDQRLCLRVINKRNFLPPRNPGKSCKHVDADDREMDVGCSVLRNDVSCVILTSETALLISTWYVVLNYPTKLVVIVLIASSVSAGRLIIKEDKHNLNKLITTDKVDINSAFLFWSHFILIYILVMIS